MVLEDRNDWLLQQIDEMCEMVAKATLDAMGIPAELDHEEIDEDRVDGLLEEHFFHARLDRLDVHAVKLVLRSDRVDPYCKLLEVKAKLREIEGDELGARRHRTRAEAIRQLAEPQ